MTRFEFVVDLALFLLHLYTNGGMRYVWSILIMPSVDTGKRRERGCGEIKDDSPYLGGEPYYVGGRDGKNSEREG